MAREMKDSGIPWIGAVPSSWNINSLSQLFVQVKNKNSNLQETNLLSLSYGKIKRRSIESSTGLLPESFDGYNIIEKDDIVLRLTDLQNDQTSLRVGLAEERGIITSAYLTIRKQAEMSAQYLFYYLYSFDISKGFYGMGGGVRQGLNWDGVKWLKVLVPPFDEQERIAIYLSQKCAEIDAVLEKTRTSIEEYKKLKQAIITQAVTKGVRGDRPMKESGIEWIGAIPENWDVRRIKSIGTYRNGLTYAPEDQTDESGTLVLRSSNVQNGKLDFSNNVFVSCEIPAQLMVQKGDILICSRNGSRELIGKSAIIDSDICASFGAFMMIFRCECPRYMYYLLNSNIFSVYLNTFLTTTINQLTGKNFGNMNVVYCPDAVEQDEITSFLDRRCLELDELIVKKISLISSLESYKKSLIYEYVTGKKEVSV